MEQSEQINELALALSVAQGAGDRHSEAALLRRMAPCRQPTLMQKFTSRLIYGMSDCWYWNGSIDELGYGRFGSAKEETGEIKAHRISWVLFNGRPIPNGMMVLHSCDVRSCVNPEHLTIGNQQDNVNDMMRRGRNRSTPMFGEKNPQAKLTAEQVIAIRREAESGSSHAVIAKKYGVAVMTVNRAIRRKTWGHV